MRLLPYAVVYQCAASHCDATEFRARMKRYAKLPVAPVAKVAEAPVPAVKRVRCRCNGMGTSGSYDSLGFERTGRCYACDGTGWRDVEVSA